MQSNNQQAYDRGVTVFSPDGRLYQVEYAREAVERGSATVGVRTGESIVLASLGRRRSPLVEPESIEKIHDLDGQLAIASAGHVADARRLVDYGRQYAQRERLRYDEAPDVETIAKAIADFVQESTQTGGSRPFGAALLVGGVTDDGPRLYEVDPSGTPYEWRATAVGNGSGDIRDHLESAYSSDLTTSDGITVALEALAAGTDAELTAEEVGLAALDDDGYRKLDREERAAALDDGDFAAS